MDNKMYKFDLNYFDYLQNLNVSAYGKIVYDDISVNIEKFLKEEQERKQKELRKKKLERILK